MFIEKITLEILRDRIATMDDEQHTRITVADNGCVHFVQYRGRQPARTGGPSKSIAAHGGYVGSAASKDDNWIQELLGSMRTMGGVTT